MAERFRAGAVAVLAALTTLLLFGGAPAAAAGPDKVIDDLMFELQLIPLDGREPAAFELERFADGKRVTLAELRGQPVLLYFWATW